MTERELGSSARALLDAARGGAPDAAVIARMRGKIDESVTATPAPATAATSTLASKLGLVALALVVATTAGILATRHSSTTEIASHEISVPAVAPSKQTVREAPPPIVAAPDATSLIEIETTVPHKKAARVAPAPSKKSITLAREVELVDRAMTALRRGELRAALAAVRLHGTETAYRGQLAEDATAIEIEALCRLHDPQATARLSAFDTRWPTSAQRARLTAACK